MNVGVETVVGSLMTSAVSIEIRGGGSDWEGKGPCAIVPLTWKMAQKSLCRSIRNYPLKISKSLKKAEIGPFGISPSWQKPQSLEGGRGVEDGEFLGTCFGLRKFWQSKPVQYFEECFCYRSKWKLTINKEVLLFWKMRCAPFTHAPKYGVNSPGLESYKVFSVLQF